MTNPALPATATLRTWAGFLLMCLGMFMAILDIQIVATSLPTIQQALGIGAQNADSDEAAPSFREDRAPLFRDDVAPSGTGPFRH